MPHAPDVVFDYAADLRHEAQWAPGVRDVRQTQGDDVAAGARYDYIQEVGRHHVAFAATATACDRPRRVAWHFTHDAVEYACTMTFRPHRHGTLVTQVNVESWHAAPGWLRLLAPAMVRKQIRRRLALLSQALADKEEGKEEEARFE